MQNSHSGTPEATGFLLSSRCAAGFTPRPLAAMKVQLHAAALSRRKALQPMMYLEAAEALIAD